MRICFIADARSAIARNWIDYFIGRGHDIHAITSYRCAPDALSGAVTYQVPIAFGGLLGSAGERSAKGPRATALKRLLHSVGDLSQGRLRTWLAPLDLYPKVGRVRRLLEQIHPELVHAMRIPFEGIIASMANRSFPLLVSCWGNDFEIWARSLPGRLLTARTVRRADAFHCDCEKDLRTIHQWGFPRDWPKLLAPGAGGIQTDSFYPGRSDEDGLIDSELADLPQNSRLVINPRGARIYVRNDIFFHAAAMVLNEIPDALFLCPALAGDDNSRKTVARLGIESRVKLLPVIPRAKMAAMFRLAEVSVSPSVCDGTPNTLLEAMACGCFPVAADIQSVREWITNGVNGLLYEHSDPQALARAIVRALREPSLIVHARECNLRLIRQKAEYATVMARAEEFYRVVIEFCRYRNNGATRFRIEH